MRHVRLGRTGLQVSRLCLGTMTFGLQCDEPRSLAILDRAAAGGITFLDAADVYPLGGSLETVGRTEEILGRWLEGRRHDVVIATKCSGAMSSKPWDRGASRKHILDAVEGSLRRLRTDYVDLYQIHHPDPQTPMDETLRALDDVVRAGKARYVGCSNYHAYQVARALGRSEALGLARFDSVQPRYNLLFRQIERELLPLCGEEGIGVIPYNPLAGGFLSGKHRRDVGPTAGTRFTLGSAPPAGGGRRHVHGPDGCGVGAGASGHHLGHRRGEPARSARRRAGRGGQGAGRRSQGGARRADTRVSLRRRSPMTVTRDPLTMIRIEED